VAVGFGSLFPTTPRLKAVPAVVVSTREYRLNPIRPCLIRLGWETPRQELLGAVGD
jgi:hypothetical protein